MNAPTQAVRIHCGTRAVFVKAVAVVRIVIKPPYAFRQLTASLPVTITTYIAVAISTPPARSPMKVTWEAKNASPAPAATIAPSVIDHCDPITEPRKVPQNVLDSEVERGR